MKDMLYKRMQMIAQKELDCINEIYELETMRDKFLDVPMHWLEELISTTKQKLNEIRSDFLVLKQAYESK